MAGAPLRVGRKLNRATNDGKVEALREELRFTSVDDFCARRLFDLDLPLPVKLIDALVHAPVVSEASLDAGRRRAA